MCIYGTLYITLITEYHIICNGNIKFLNESVASYQNILMLPLTLGWNYPNSKTWRYVIIYDLGRFEGPKQYDN